MSITEIKDTKKLIEIINKDKEKLSKEEKKFLEEKFQLLLNDAKEKALKEKDYTLLIKLTSEEMRTKIKTEREDIEKYTRLNMYYDPTRIEKYQIVIREDKALQKKIIEKIEENDKYYKKLNAYIAARKAGRDYVVNERIPEALEKQKKDKKVKIPTYCNLYVEIELAEKYEIMIPANGKEGKTANQIYDYVIKSEEWEQIARVNGKLDHATAQKMAAEGYVVLAVYKNTYVEDKVKFASVNSSVGALSGIGLTAEYTDKDNVANMVVYINNNIMLVTNQSKLSLSNEAGIWDGSTDKISVIYTNNGTKTVAGIFVTDNDKYASEWINASNITISNTIISSNIPLEANQSKLSLSWNTNKISAIYENSGTTSTAMDNDKYTFALGAASNITIYGKGNTFMVLEKYKETSEGNGHVVFVTGEKKYFDTYGVVEINGLNTLDKEHQAIQTERFSLQFGKTAQKTTEFFYYKLGEK
jgi:hypothetical protein